MSQNTNQQHVTILDGGMGRELLRTGAPFQQPEWSALALMEAPERVQSVHESFAAAGSEVLTTSNYAVVPFHIGEDRFLAKGGELTALAGKLAREAAVPYGCRVAGCLPPLFGSYRPDLFVPDRAPELLKTIVDALSPTIDLWLAETTSSISEAEAVAKALKDDNRPLWIAYTLSDNDTWQDQSPRLRSGETVRNAVQASIEFGCAAILFNCSQPEVMAPAIKEAQEEMSRQQISLPIGVYANAFPPQSEVAEANSNLLEIRKDVDPNGYLHFVSTWCNLGATIIGGCCGIGPEHIAALNRWLQKE